MLRRSLARLALAPTGELVRGFRVDQVMSQVAATDYVYALQGAPQLFTFACIRDADSLAVADEILKIDQSDRVVHSIFGRAKVPVDFYADIEFPTWGQHLNNVKGASHDNLNEDGSRNEELDEESAQAKEKPYTGESVAIDVIKATTDLLKEHYDVAPSVTALFDGGTTAEKHSYHLHMRLPSAAFLDYTFLGELHSEINVAVGVQAIDLSTNRPNGMLRLAYTPKFTSRDRVLLPVVPQDSELKRMVSSMKELSPRELLAMSLITRTDEIKKDPDSIKLLSTSASLSGGKRLKKQYDDVTGRVIQPHLYNEKKPLRFKEACARVAALPMHLADSYDTWIRIGLSLHSFNDPEAFNKWLQFSSKSPSKFDPAVCERYWAIFARRDNCFNWRRGYMYIMKSTAQSKTGAGGGRGGRKKGKW